MKAVRFGDTGTPLDEKQGRYTLGPLMCEGDDLFNNVVTFRVSDATIELPQFDMGHSGDVYFEFKTTIENAVLFHATVKPQPKIFLLALLLIHFMLLITGTN